MASRNLQFVCGGVLLLVVFQGCTAVQWASSATWPDGVKITACVGQILTLNWTYVLDPSEHIDDVQWYYQAPGQTAQLQAILVDGSLLPIPGATKQLTFISNAGVKVLNASLQDAGTYSVSVHVNRQGAITTETQSVDVRVAGPEECLSVEERLQKCRASHSDLTTRLAPLASKLQANNATLQTLTRQLNTCHNRDTSPAPTAPPPTYPPWFRPTNCRDVRVFDTTTGVYTIYLRNVTTISVYCDQEFQDGGWLVIQRRYDGSENFYRNMAEYERGFGDLRGEFWLGLSAISNLTKYQAYSLRIDIEDFEGRKLYAEYGRFYVESYRYELIITDYSGSAGESMRYNSHQYFSTYDSDNDKWPNGNCAQTMHGGWWYNSCGSVNINGQYKNANGFGVDNMIWAGAYGTSPIRKTEMKIKPLPTV